MVPTGRAVLQFCILILCTINGLHSYPHKHPSLGILNELIGTDSKSPLIVVVDSNNQAKTLDDEPDHRYGQVQGQSHSKSCPNHPDNVNSPSHNYNKNSDNFSNQDYEAALYELLRTSEKMMEYQGRQGRSYRGRNGKNGKNGKNGAKKDSCENNEKIKDSCENNEKKKDSCENNEKKKDSCENDEKKKDSCEPNKQEFLAEQCSNSENSCDTC